MMTPTALPEREGGGETRAGGILGRSALGLGLPVLLAQDGAGGALAESKARRDRRSAFRYGTVRRRKALKSSSLYISLAA